MTSKHASLAGIIAASLALSAAALGCHSESQGANQPSNTQASQGDNSQNMPSGASTAQAPQQPSSTSEYGNPGSSGTTGQGQGGTMGQSSPSQPSSPDGMGQQPGQMNQQGQSGQPNQNGQGQMGQQNQADQNNPSTMNDGDILAIEAAADRAEIQAAQLAQTKAVNADVKAYAGRMLNAHGRDLYKINQLEKAEKITPNASNKDAVDIESNAKDELTTLRGKTGKDFDKEYIDSQVKAHEKVLKAIDDALPNVKDPQLKQHLTMLRTHVNQHLKDAEAIQGKL